MNCAIEIDSHLKPQNAVHTEAHERLDVKVSYRNQNMQVIQRICDEVCLKTEIDNYDAEFYSLH